MSNSTVYVTPPKNSRPIIQNVFMSKFKVKTDARISGSLVSIENSA